MPERSIDVAIRGKDQSKQATDQASANAKKFGDRIKSLRSALKDYTIIATGAIRAGKALASALSAPIKAARVQLEAENRLGAALTQVTADVSGNMRAMRSWASEIQNATGIGDEFTLQLASVMQAMGRMAPEATRRATEAALYWGEVTGNNASAMVNVMGRALQGGQVAWSRYGIAVDTSLPPQEQAIVVAEKLISQYKQIAIAMGSTLPGQMRKLDAAYGDFIETIGLAWVKTDVFNNMLQILTGTFSGVDQGGKSTEWAKNLDKFLKPVILAIGGVIVGIVRLIESLKGASFLGVEFGESTEAMNKRLDGLQESAYDANQAFHAYRKELGMAPISAYAVLDSMKGITDESDEQRNKLAGLAKSFVDARAAFDQLDNQIKAAEGMASAADQIEALLAQLAGFNAQAEALRNSGGASVFDGMYSSAGRLLEKIAANNAALEAFQNNLSQVASEGSFDQLLGQVDAFREKFGEVPLHIQSTAETMLTFRDEFAGAFLTMSDSISSGVGQLFVDLNDKTMKTSEAFKKFGEGIYKNLLQTVGKGITKVVLAPLNAVIDAIANWFAKLLFGAILEKQLQAAAAAATLAINAPLAAALTALYAAPAYLANVATLGAANLFGAQAIAAAQAARLTAVAGAEGFEMIKGPTFMLTGEGQHPETLMPFRPGSALELLQRSQGAEEFFGRAGNSVVVGDIIVNVEGGVEDANALAEAISELVAVQILNRTGRLGA